MYTDIHVHNTSPEVVERIIGECAPFGVTRFLFLGDVVRYGATPDEAQVRQANDDTLAALRRHPECARGLCYLNPLLPREFLRAEMARCLDCPRIAGVKLWIAVPCRDRRLDPILEELERRGKILLHHIFDKTVNQCPGESRPGDIAELARRWPRVRMVMAHLGGIRKRGVEAVADLPNVSVDTSGSQPEDGLVEYAVRRLGAGRVLYGTDLPYRDPAAQIARVTDADISRADQERILGENARELLDWP